MNTPAHVAASILIWRNEPSWSSALAVVGGALLPDLPMFGFYAYQKLVAGSTEAAIWSNLYFQDNWQLLFDLLNSIPLAIVGLAISRCCRFRWGVMLCASMLVHLLFDLPLHHDDAHRHFLPFSNWRFASPVSYWDPRHFGAIFVWIELAFALLTSIYVARSGKHLPMRVAAMATLALYAAGITLILVVWLPQL